MLGSLLLSSAAQSGLTLKRGHVYSATFSDGPAPAVETSCVAYSVNASADWLQLSTRFSASAGGEVWAHDSLLFSLDGSLAAGETASLRFTNVTATAAPFVLRLSTPTVGPADALTFKATDDTACPSRHCLLPDAAAHLTSPVNTPKCGFDTASVVVEQPISPNMPASGLLAVDVTSLLREGPRALKVALVPDQKTTDGFWGAKLQLGGAHLVTASVPTSHAYCCTSCAAGGCSAFYSPDDVGRPYACSKGGKIVPLKNHGETCA